MEWDCAGHGLVRCEPHGVLSLNRYQSLAAGEVTLAKWFRLEREAEVEIEFGFSEEMTC